MKSTKKKLMFNRKTPKRMMNKYGTIYERTEYGSYVNIKDYGMVQEKNAMSYAELIKYGYKNEQKK